MRRLTDALTRRGRERELGVAIAFVSAWIATHGACVAHEGPHPEKPATFTDRVQHAPTPLPDRLILTWSDDPATSVDVTWRTDQTVGDAVVQYAPAIDLRGSLRVGAFPGSESVGGSSDPFSSDLGVSLRHSARLRELTPGTMYAYRVGDGQHWSEWHQFRTASDANEPFTFVYFGDAQNAVRSLWSRVIREANQHAPRCAFFLHAGDLVNRPNSDGEWGEWFGAGGWLNGMIPSVATPGNHEYRGSLSAQWRPSFSFPTNGPESLEETVYWFDYQGVRIVSLNSNEQIERQTPWLDAVLSDPARPKWTVVTFHHPIFSAAKERDNPTLRAAWRPLLEKHGVDLVLQGHDHAYARSGLGGPRDAAAVGNVNVSEGVTRKSSNTVYVVSVSGPKMYPLQEKWDVARVASGVQLFQVIHMGADRIRYEARLASGELYDAFELEKSAEGVSRLIEKPTYVEEIRAMP
ncbi:MAG: metallophosphoesterase family protein [Planctomycetota bacterium]